MSRIARLPTRDWRPRAAALAAPLSAILRTPDGTQTLRPVQAAGLVEAVELGGLFEVGRVGSGKSLQVALLPTVFSEARFFGDEPVRALLLCPGGILRATSAHFDEMRAHGWRLPPPTRYVLTSYERISRLPAAGLGLESLFGGEQGPNIIICDEVDALKSVGSNPSARASVIEDWLCRHPQTVFAAFTGTPDVDGLPNYGHLLHWALRDNAPMPALGHDRERWSSVLDAGDDGPSASVARDLGAAPDATILELRNAYRRRLYESPGCLVFDEPYQGSDLVVREHVLDDPATEEHFARLRDLWQRPDGLDADEEDDDAADPDRVQGSSIWAVARRMGRGLCYVWDPLPPQAWLEARRGYWGWVRSQLASKRFLSELQARRWAIQADHRAWRDWVAVRDTFALRSKTLWLSDAALRWAEEWGRAAPGVIWVDDIAFGVELARRTGWPYYRDGGRAANGQRIPNGRGPRSRDTIIASRRACGTGLNLQYRWSRCLFTAPPCNSRDFEQNVGRFHRENQVADEVRVDILVTCQEDVAALARVQESARRTAESFYSQKAASYNWPKAVPPRRGRAWSDNPR